MKTTRFFYYGKFVVLGILALIAFTFVVMWLWNWLVPDLFKGPEITYWQTLGILVLSKILFSGFGKGHHDHDHDHKFRPPSHYRDKWRKKYDKKMNGIVEEEKEKEGEEKTEE